MEKINDLFQSEIQVINLGLSSFYEADKAQGLRCCQVDWKPPAGGNERLAEILAELDQLELRKKIDAANQVAFERMDTAEPELIDVQYACDVLNGLDDRTIGHAGPPLAWEDMCGPLRGAIEGAAVYEGMAQTLEEAEDMAAHGEIRFVSNHSLGCVGPMTGMITKSMPLFVVKNRKFGNVAYSTFNEGLGKVMRFGANGEEVIQRLKWIETKLAPAFKKALELSGPISLKVLIAKALSMGDEMHQRNIAASSLLVREIAPYLVKAVQDRDDLFDIMKFISGNDQFFLNLAMAAGKATMDPVKNIPYCSVVTAMSRNGTNFGIKVSALGRQVV